MGEKYCDEIKCPYNQEETCGFQAANDRTSYSMEEWPKLREAFFRYGCREEVVKAAAPAINLRKRYPFL